MAVVCRHPFRHVWAFVVVEDSLVILSWCERHSTLAIADRKERHLWANETFLDDEGRACGAECITRQVLVHRRFCFGAIVRDEHALASGQAIGLDDERLGHCL